MCKFLSYMQHVGLSFMALSPEGTSAMGTFHTEDD